MTGLRISFFSAAAATALCALLVATTPTSVAAFGVPSQGVQTRFVTPVASPRLGKSTLFYNAQTKLPTSRTTVDASTSGKQKRTKVASVLKFATRAAIFSATLVTVTSAIAPPAAFAAAQAQEVVEHLHVGQKIANYFRSFGLPDLAILALISALPVVELRGAVPVGVWMGLPITKVLPVCVLGNMTPIIPLLFLLRNDKLKSLMSPILSRAEKKSASLGVGSIEKQWASLAAFVGIPLPGTGAWTGAMGAFLLGMPTAVALSSIFTGVTMAGVIMSAITLAGKKGGLAALAALALITGREFLTKNEDGEKEE